MQFYSQNMGPIIKSVLMSLAQLHPLSPFRAKVITFRQNGYFREKVITHLAKQALWPKGYRDIHKVIS